MFCERVKELLDAFEVVSLYTPVEFHIVRVKFFNWRVSEALHENIVLIFENELFDGEIRLIPGGVMSSDSIAE